MEQLDREYGAKIESCIAVSAALSSNVKLCEVSFVGFARSLAAGNAAGDG